MALSDEELHDTTQVEHVTKAYDSEYLAGPDIELVFWRNRMTRYNSVTEYLKSRETHMVLGVVTTAKSKIFKSWKHMDNSITDSLNEAKDNVRSCSTMTSPSRLLIVCRD